MAESIKIEFADGHDETFSPEEWRLVCQRAPIDCALRLCYGPDAKRDDRCPTTTFPSRDFHLLRAWLLSRSYPTAYSDAVLLWHEMERWQIPVPADYFWRWPEHWMGRLKIDSVAWCAEGDPFIVSSERIFWDERKPRKDSDREIWNVGPMFHFSPDGKILPTSLSTLTSDRDYRFSHIVYHKTQCARTLIYSVTKKRSNHMFDPYASKYSHSLLLWLPADTKILSAHRVEGKLCLPVTAHDFPSCLLYRQDRHFFLASGFESKDVKSKKLIVPDPRFTRTKLFGRLIDGTIWFNVDNALIFCNCGDGGHILPFYDVRFASDAQREYNYRIYLLSERTLAVLRTASIGDDLIVLELFSFEAPTQCAIAATEPISADPILRIEMKNSCFSSMRCNLRTTENSDHVWIIGVPVFSRSEHDAINHIFLYDLRQRTILWQLHGPDEIRRLLPSGVHGSHQIIELMPIGGNLLLAHPTGFVIVGHSDERPLFSSEFMHAATMIPE